jgi:hypothetical protein
VGDNAPAAGEGDQLEAASRAAHADLARQEPAEPRSAERVGDAVEARRLAHARRSREQERHGGLIADDLVHPVR